MNRKVVIHEIARLDLIDIAYYIAEDSLAASDRFIDCFNDSSRHLADMPGIGVSRAYNNPELSGMRMWPISGFSNYLIFYRSTATELLITRVLHGSQDIESLFAPRNLAE